MKILYTFLFIAIANSAYSQKNIIEQNALKWFKSIYVEENFKDPYSFKLLKISSIPQNTYETIKTDDIYPLFVELGFEKNDINAIDTSLINTSIQVYKDLIKGKWEGSEDRIKYLKRIEKLLLCKSNMMTLININSNKVLKNKICRYGIYIDCYSNNSYGNKILGKFAFFYYPNGSLLYKSFEKYSYSNFMIDENSIVQINKN
jgi:hypothetical protein